MSLPLPNSDSPRPAACPQCGLPVLANAALGLCPACLLAAGAPSQTEARPAAFTPPAAAELAGQFPQLEIFEIIGRGGMGAVYRARQRELDRLVALKILPRSLGDDPAFADRFTREARALAQLNHPGIVTLYEFGRTDDGLFFILMEFVDGVIKVSLYNPNTANAVVLTLGTSSQRISLQNSASNLATNVTNFIEFTFARAELARLTEQKLAPRIRLESAYS